MTDYFVQQRDRGSSKTGIKLVWKVVTRVYHEDREILYTHYEGSIADCESWIRLKKDDLILEKK